MHVKIFKMASNKLQSVGMVCFVFSAVIGRFLILSGSIWSLQWFITTLLAGCLMFLSCVLGGVFIFLASRRISEHSSILSTLRQFVFTYYGLYYGRKRLKHLKSYAASNPRYAQEVRLTEILSRNRHTDYAIRYSLGQIDSLREYQTNHPLTSYDHFEPYIERLAKGEKNVLTSEPVTRLALSSGTTGKVKNIPRNMGALFPELSILSAIYNECFPEVQCMQKSLRIHCNSKLRKSKGGITKAAVTAFDERMVGFTMACSTPPDGFLVETVQDSYYVHLLFALRARELGFVAASFTSMIVEAFKYLEEHWPKMVKDIQNGTIDESIKLSPGIRKKLTEAMGPGDVERAEEVRRECERGQQGIMKRLWTNMAAARAIDNLGIRGKLMKTIGEGIIFYSPLYTCSEATIGINIDPFQKGTEEFLLSVDTVVFEFIREEDIGQRLPKTYLIDEVQVGKNYELVITQICGLYRYRLGDVIQVTGYYRECPKVKFLYRTGTMLNLFGEKVDQITVADSVKGALSDWPGVEMVNYCVAESTLVSQLQNYKDEITSSFYVFFIELRNDVTSHQTVDSEKLATKIDEIISERHLAFRSFLDKNQISPSKVYLLKSGSFDKLKYFILENRSTSVTQFKMPKKLRTIEAVTLMLKNVL